MERQEDKNDSSKRPELDSRIINVLYDVVKVLVRVLAVFMVFVILMGVVDVGWTIYQKLMAPPFLILTISDMLATFGAFMAVLIAIEILINITIYLREDVIHVKIVIATALMAIARKVIILDLSQTEPQYLYGIGVIVLALSVAYWMIYTLPKSSHVD